MPPDRRSVPRNSRVRSVTLATVSRTSRNTRCPSLTSASAAGVMRTCRPTRRNSGSPSSSSSSAIWRLMADCDTWSFRPHAVNDPVSAMAWRISSWRRSTAQYIVRAAMRIPRLLKSLYVQVLVGIAAGVILGFVAPEKGAAMRPLGDGFIKLGKMLIAPIVFSTVVVGIAHMGAMREVGRIGLRALLYFEAVSTLALVIGLVVVNVLQPGAGLTIDPASLDMKTVSSYTSASKSLTTVD